MLPSHLNAMIRRALLLACALCGASLQAAEPSGYYDSCKGKYGATLLAKLEDVVGSHTSLTYKGLWEAFKTTDVNSAGKIIDLYSNKLWTAGSEQCGNYSNVGSCYNREHSFPKSWFNDEYPMRTDLFHLYPTDGYVNNQRSNYPFGECENGTRLTNGSLVGKGKKGSSTYAGYTGIVFEPDDEYKGDFARSYFYMAAAYNSQISSWSSDQLAGNSYPAFSSWSVKMFMEWHHLDPVSEKELARNEAVYGLQGNRNPFIDHPELADHIWGDAKTTAWTGSASVATLATPADGSTLNVGTTVMGVNRTLKVNVSGTAFTQSMTLSCGSSTQFSVSPLTLTASQVNAGTPVTVTYSPLATGDASATLTLSSGSTSWKVTLKGSCVDHVPALAASDVTDESFTARWSDISGEADATYSLTVVEKATGKPVDDFNGLAVKASLEKITVDGLQPATDYEYYVEYLGTRSNVVSVTTASPAAMIELTASDGSLQMALASTAGEPGPEAIVFVNTEGLTGDVTLLVDCPFEISLDKETWSTSLVMDRDNGHVYVRLNAADEGDYEGWLRAEADDDVAASFYLTGTTSSAGFSNVGSAVSGSFDAHCAAPGQLVVEGPATVLVYGIDGTIWFNGYVGRSLVLELPRGVYLVAGAGSDDLRRVAVR